MPPVQNPILGDAILHGPKGQMVDNHYVHNVYLEIALRLGVPALSLFVILLGAYFRNAVRNLHVRWQMPSTSGFMLSGLCEKRPTGLSSKPAV